MADELKRPARQRRVYAKVACLRCRQLRKKCMGGFPCTRCVTSDCVCEVFSAATNEVVRYTATGKEDTPTHVPAAPAPCPAPTPSLEARVAALESALKPLAHVCESLNAVERALLGLQQHVLQRGELPSIHGVHAAQPPPGKVDDQRVVPLPRFGGTMEWAQGTIVMGTGMVTEHVDAEVAQRLFHTTAPRLRGKHTHAMFLSNSRHLVDMWRSTSFVLGPHGLRIMADRHDKFLITPDGDLVAAGIMAEGDWLHSGDMRYTLHFPGWFERVKGADAAHMALYRMDHVEIFALLDTVMRRMRAERPETAQREVLFPPTDVVRHTHACLRADVRYCERVDFAREVAALERSMATPSMCGSGPVPGMQHARDDAAAHVGGSSTLGELPPLQHTPPQHQQGVQQQQSYVLSPLCVGAGVGRGGEAGLPSPLGSTGVMMDGSSFLSSDALGVEFLPLDAEFWP